MNRHDISVTDQVHPETPSRRKRWIRRHYVSLITIACIIILSLVLYLIGGISRDLAAYGYIGVFFISILAGSVILVPIPGVPVVFLMGAILNPFLVGLVAGVGETIGEIAAYTAGFSGREAMEKKERFTRIRGWMKRRGTLVLFLFSAIPNLFFDLVGAAAGAMRYPFWKYLLVVLIGKTIKGTVFALLGYWALQLLLKAIIG